MDREYLCGEFSLADIATWLCLAFGQTLGATTTGFSKLEAWYARVQARPAVTAEFEQIMSAAATA